MASMPSEVGTLRPYATPPSSVPLLAVRRRAPLPELSAGDPHPGIGVWEVAVLAVMHATLVPAGAPGSTHSDDDVVVPVNGSLTRTTPLARASCGGRATNPRS